MPRLLLLLISLSVCSLANGSTIAPQHWEMARMSDVVAVGTAQQEGRQLRFTATSLLKGKAGASEFLFEAPPVESGTASPDEFWRYFPVPPDFVSGKPMIVFLAQEDGSHRFLCAFPRTDEIEQNVREVAQLDSLSDADSKSEFLIELAIDSASKFYAREELIESYAKEEYLDRFEIFTKHQDTKAWFVTLLASTQGKQATQRLLRILKAGDEDMLLIAVATLGLKDMQNREVTKALVPFLEDSDPLVRAQTIVALDSRNHREVRAQIANSLTDPSPQVRAAAAGWSWRKSEKVSSEAVQGLRRLLRDEDQSCRAASSQALTELGDSVSFYRLWWMSLFDRSDYVRRTIPLNDLLQRRPVTTGAMLLWPTIVAMGIAILVRRRRGRKSLPIVSVVLGYIVGVLIGYAIGELRTSQTLIYSLLLTPAAVAPVCILLSCLLRPRHKTSAEGNAAATAATT